MSVYADFSVYVRFSKNPLALLGGFYLLPQVARLAVVLAWPHSVKTKTQPQQANLGKLMITYGKFLYNSTTPH